MRAPQHRTRVCSQGAQKNLQAENACGHVERRGRGERGKLRGPTPVFVDGGRGVPRDRHWSGDLAHRANEAVAVRRHHGRRVPGVGVPDQGPRVPDAGR